MQSDLNKALICSAVSGGSTLFVIGVLDKKKTYGRDNAQVYSLGQCIMHRILPKFHDLGLPHLRS